MGLDVFEWSLAQCIYCWITACQWARSCIIGNEMWSVTFALLQKCVVRQIQKKRPMANYIVHSTCTVKWLNVFLNIFIRSDLVIEKQLGWKDKNSIQLQGQMGLIHWGLMNWKRKLIPRQGDAYRNEQLAIFKKQKLRVVEWWWWQIRSECCEVAEQSQLIQTVGLKSSESFVLYVDLVTLR